MWLMELISEGVIQDDQHMYLYVPMKPLEMHRHYYLNH